MKGKSCKYVRDVDHMSQNIEKKLPRNWIQSKLFIHLVKKVWISSLTFILILWWIELCLLRSHRNVYQNYIINFKDNSKKKIVFYQTSIAFLPTGKPVSSRLLVETSYSDGFYLLHVPNFMKFWVTVQIEYGC